MGRGHQQLLHPWWTALSPSADLRKMLEGEGEGEGEGAVSYKHLRDHET